MESNALDGPVLRVLVAEDDRDVLDVVASFLADDGFVVGVANTGTELLNLLTSGPQPNLILTDVQMPGLSGLDVLLYAKQHYSEIPVILMTGLATDVLLERARACGAAAVLVKPFGNRKLHDLVARHIRRD